ncbi:MAG: hypothetical protein HN948_10280, partial [Clostridia bacterium]|nr:hypothetical protein [Clostridia bacterium]
MKKFISILIVLLFISAAFFVLSGFSDSGDQSDTQASPRLSFVPIITTFDFIVNIPDPNLKAALHTATGVPPGDNIVSGDLKALTGSLLFDDKDISNLEGIQFCNKIKVLSLDGNNLSSLLSDMAGLAKLEIISLEDNNFTSVPPAIGTMPKLKTIK